MPTAEVDAYAAATAAATRKDGTIDEDRRFELYKAEYERQVAERHDRLEQDARASYRAMADWQLVTGPAEWQEVVGEAVGSIEDGSFLIERLGSARHLDPTLMAVLLVLRRRLVEEYGAESAADLMLIDVAVLGYYHTLRINGWIGNLSMLLEGEFFGKDSLNVVVEGRKRSSWDTRIKGLRVSEIVEQIGNQLLPLLDRSNRMMLRNLKALQARRQLPTPTVSIGTAGQVNVAAAQQNQFNAEDAPNK